MSRENDYKGCNTLEANAPTRSDFDTQIYAVRMVRKNFWFG